jgi:microsomal epoxide hydrolase
MEKSCSIALIHSLEISLMLHGFSFKPDEPFGPVKTAELWKQLMVDVLGYKRFASHAGDLGGLVQVQLAHRYPQHLIGVHFLNIATNPIPETEMNEEEKAWAAQANAFFQAEMSYFPQQMIKPATVAFALADNPVGAAAWALEKIYAWSDHRGYFEELFSKERLLDMVMVYLVTQTAGSAMAFYGGIPRETQWMLHPGEKIAVPTAVANFPADYLNAHPPRSLAERFYNIIQWNSFERGGHFPGLEVPEDLVADLKTFFHQLQS